SENIHIAVHITVHIYVSNNPGRPFKSQEANSPFSYKIDPAAAIIAALSVHKYSGGICTGIFVDSKHSIMESRKPPFAATPPATITCFTPYAFAALNVFSVNTSTTLACKLAATSSFNKLYPLCFILCT